MEQEKKTTPGKSDHTRIGAVIVLVISAIVFLPTGGAAVFQSLFGKNDIPVFGSYKGQKIEYAQGSPFVSMLSNLSQQSELMGYSLNSFSLFQETFNRMISDMYYKDAVQASGYTVPSEAVNRAIISSGAYSDEDGNYSARRYNQTDAATRNSLRTSITEALTYARYTDDVMGAAGVSEDSTLYGLKLPGKEADFVARMGRNKHAFTLASFSTADLPLQEAASYGQANAAKFTRFSLSVISLSDKSDADAVRKQLQNTEITFEDAVQEKSQGFYADADGKLSDSYQYQILDLVNGDSEAADAIQTLAPGDLSDVIRTERGYSIFRCDGAPVAADFADEDTLRTVSGYIKANEQGYIENYYITIAKDFVDEAARTSFDEAYQAFTATEEEGGKGYQIAKADVPAFPINYGSSSFFDAVPSGITQLARLSDDADAMRTLFALRQDELSAPFVLGANVLVAQCTGIEDADVAIENYGATADQNDQTSARTRILTSPDVENNFFATYSRYFLQQRFE